MATRVLLDSNLFIFGFELRESNSHRVLDLLSAGVIRGVVTDRIVREVMGYFRRYYGKDMASRFRELILLSCDLVLEDDLDVADELVARVGPKDAGALAAARVLGLARLVSTDRDFEGVPEHRTPRQFLVEVGEPPRRGEE